MTIQKTLSVLAALAFASTGAVSAQSLTAFKTGEVTTGMTKQCFYNAIGNTYTHTIQRDRNLSAEHPSAADVCPRTCEPDVCAS